jgi:hypothetical protein
LTFKLQAIETDFRNIDKGKDGVIEFEELLDGVNWDGSSKSKVWAGCLQNILIFSAQKTFVIAFCCSYCIMTKYPHLINFSYIFQVDLAGRIQAAFKIVDRDESNCEKIDTIFSATFFKTDRH